MQEKKSQKVIFILDALQEHFHVENRSALARKLGVGSSTVLGWINRGNIGEDTRQALHRKFPEIRYEWLETGEGEMLDRLQAKNPAIDALLPNFSVGALTVPMMMILRELWDKTPEEQEAAFRKLLK